MTSSPSNSSITSAEVIKVARLARLDIDAAQVEHFTEQLAKVLGHFTDVDALDLSDVQPMTQAYPLANILRQDVEQPCLDRDEVLAAAPQAQDGRFRVPTINGEA